MTDPDPHADGRRRAEDFLALLEGDLEGQGAAADRFLAELTDVRDLVFVGAGLTAAWPATRTDPTATLRDE